MFTTLELIRYLLVPFLIATALLLVSALVGLAAQRTIRLLVERRRVVVEQRYRSSVLAVLESQADAARAAALLRSAPRRHHGIIATLLVKSLRLLHREPVERARDSARDLGLISHWRRAIGDRRWWKRADAALALGLVREDDAFDALVTALDDPHDEVRAAAAEALGRLGELRAVPVLLARLGDQSRHQSVRIVDAIAMLGGHSGKDLLEHARQYPAQLPLLNELIASVAGSQAVPDLLQWTGAASAPVRAAALHALGTIGLDNHSFYYALRGLNDEDDEVRAMAARALGRTGRDDAVSYLAAHLEDAWVVAANCARALSALGPAGLAILEARAEAGDPAGVLSRHMLWERRAGPA